MSDWHAALCDWLENKAEETMKEAMSRRDMERTMKDATENDLEQGRLLAQRMAGRKLPKTTKKDAEEQARLQGRIAAKLEVEARQISAWAEMLRKHNPKETRP